jgi:acetyl esterase/lipase
MARAIAAKLWTKFEADKDLRLDPARIGIKGESGGGGLAAAAALYARDREGPKFAFQHLIYPMIDDRSAVRKDLHPFVGEFVWTQENNHFGWRSLLGEEPGLAGVSPYAAAARAADVRGLPPTYISVGGLDLFLEENLTYADRLSRAGVPVELHIYPRAYHGFYRATNARVTKQAEHDTRKALRRFLHGSALADDRTFADRHQCCHLSNAQHGQSRCFLRSPGFRAEVW